MRLPRKLKKSRYGTKKTNKHKTKRAKILIKQFLIDIFEDRTYLLERLRLRCADDEGCGVVVKKDGVG